MATEETGQRPASLQLRAFGQPLPRGTGCLSGAVCPAHKGCAMCAFVREEASCSPYRLPEPQPQVRGQDMGARWAQGEEAWPAVGAESGTVVPLEEGKVLRLH